MNTCIFALNGQGLLSVDSGSSSAHALVRFLKSHRTWEQEAARGGRVIFIQPLQKSLYCL